MFDEEQISKTDYYQGLSEFLDKEISMFYNVELQGDVLRVGFTDQPANNDDLVKEAVRKVRLYIDDLHGVFLKINGAASLAVAIAIACQVKGVVSGIAVFDPKLQKYVVVHTLNPYYQLGDLID